MKILLITITFNVPWVHSLKEKRSILKSLIQKTRNKFNVSVSETANQDIHQIITISIASIAGNSSHADKVYEEIIKFIENNTDATIIKIDKDYL